MSSREPDPRRNALSTLLPEPAVNALPLLAARDATRVAPPPPFQPRSAAAPRRMDTVRAAPERGWFGDMTASAARWMREHKVPSVTEYPPVKLLTMLLGEDPMSGTGGPGKAISAFAARSPQVMRRFADPDFHRWMIKHGPPRGYFSQLRDWAPETVIDDLYRQYQSSPAGQSAARRAATRVEREAARNKAQQGRRSTDR